MFWSLSVSVILPVSDSTSASSKLFYHIFVVDPNPDANQVGSASLYRSGSVYRARRSGSVWIPRTCIFYFFHGNFNMLSKILQNITSFPLMEKEKHCKLAFLRINLLSLFSNMGKSWHRIRIRIGIVLIPIRIRIQIWIGTTMEIRIRIDIKTIPIHNTVPYDYDKRKSVNYLEFRVTESKQKICHVRSNGQNFRFVYSFIYLFTVFDDLHCHQKPPCMYLSVRYHC